MSISCLEGIRLDAYDRIRDLLKSQGCFRVGESGLYNMFDDTKQAHDFLDELRATGRIKLLTPVGTWGQYEIYSDGKVQ